MKRNPTAEAAHRSQQRETLRRLLLTGDTYTTAELVRLVSPRFGARLMELRRGMGGPALDIRTCRLNGKGSEWAYTCCGTLTAPEQLGGDVVAQLEAKLVRIHRQEERLLERLAVARAEMAGGA